MIKKLDIALGLTLPWVLIVYLIPLSVYYIDDLVLRGISIFLITLSANIFFRLAKEAHKNHKYK